VKKKNVYEAVTDIFIKKCEERLAAGNAVAPWRQTWNPALGMPRNMVSGKPYRGMNVFMTMLSGFNNPLWVTRRQVKILGGTIREGENYTPVTFWWFPDSSNPEERGRAPFVKFYQAFNVEQVDGIEEHVAKAMSKFSSNLEAVNPIEAAEAIVKGYTGSPEIHFGGSHAYYAPTKDIIGMPLREAFESSEAFYRTLFHELSHSTGHRTRLAREGVVNTARFGDHAYSEEELIAEMSASMLAGFAGIGSPEADDNSAAYLDTWLRKLRAEPKMLEIAGRGAQKAADWIMGNRPKGK